MEKARMSTWVKAMFDKDMRKDADYFSTDKIEDMNRLRESGLPHYEEFSFPYLEFENFKDEFNDFIIKHERVLVRALPDDIKKLPKDSKFCNSIEGSKKFLEDFIPKNNKENYDVFTTANPLNKYAGVMIINESLIIEMIEGPLDPLTHMKDCLISAEYKYIGSRNYKSLIFQKNYLGNEEQRSLIRRVMNYTFNGTEKKDFEPRQARYQKGYYEFEIDFNDKIYFTDFKTNPAYLHLNR